MKIASEISKYYLFDEDEIRRAIEHPEPHYKKVDIEQTNGDKRFIFAPSKVMKMCQTYLLKHYLCELVYSEHAFAYTKKRSIVNCAEIHVGNKHFLHLDIRHFFDNIDWGIFCKKVLSHDPKSKMASLLINEPEFCKNILCLNGRFCQGSVTSPYVSNYFLKDFDNDLNNYIVTSLENGKYSRYSDDVYISSSTKIDSSIVSFVIQLLRRDKLRINYKKIRFSSIGDSIKILGVTVTRHSKITLNTKYKNMVKRLLYKALITPEKVDKKRLIGLMYYSYMVDPFFFNQLQTKYSSDGKLALTRILEIEE